MAVVLSTFAETQDTPKRKRKEKVQEEQAVKRTVKRFGDILVEPAEKTVTALRQPAAQPGTALSGAWDGKCERDRETA